MIKKIILSFILTYGIISADDAICEALDACFYAVPYTNSNFSHYQAKSPKEKNVQEKLNTCLGNLYEYKNQVLSTFEKNECNCQKSYHFQCSIFDSNAMDIFQKLQEIDATIKEVLEYIDLVQKYIDEVAHADELLSYRARSATPTSQELISDSRTINSAR